MSGQYPTNRKRSVRALKINEQGSQTPAQSDYYQESQLPASIFNDFQQASGELEFEISANTLRSYQTSFAIFEDYCAYHQVCPLPADPRVVIAFIGQQKEMIQANGTQLSKATLITRLAAIRFFHLQQGYKTPTEHPMILRIMRGLSRNHQRIQAEYDQQPILYPELEMMLAQVDLQKSELIRARDKALLTLGFQGGFRRSELANLQVNQLNFMAKQLRVRLAFSKANQQGQKEWKDLPFDEPMAANQYVREWLQLANLNSSAGAETGHLFRSISRCGLYLRPYYRKMPGEAGKNSGFMNGDDIYKTIKKYIRLAGLDDTWFGAHSLRSGCVTQLHENEKDVLYIMGRTGHTDPRSLRHYVKSK